MNKIKLKKRSATYNSTPKIYINFLLLEKETFE